MELNLQADQYIWLTYQEVYDKSIQIGSSIRERGVNPVRAFLGFPFMFVLECSNLVLSFVYFDWIRILIEYDFTFGFYPMGIYVMEIVWCGQGGRCGIYGSNCPEWIIAMEVCLRHLLIYLNYVVW